MTTTDIAVRYIRAHVNFARDMLDGRKPETSFEGMLRLQEALEKKLGRNVADAVVTRAKAAVSEVFGGEPAPPLAQPGRVPWALVDADVFAERLVSELRQMGISRAGADWETRLDAAVVARRDLEVARLEKRVAAAEEQRKAAAATRAAPAPAPLQHVELPAEVTPVTETRSAESEPPPMRYYGVWKVEQSYSPGAVVTHNSVPWCCRAPTTKKPGESSDWILVAKGVLGPSKHSNYLRTLERDGVTP